MSDLLLMPQKKYQIAILGGSGYTGGELIRLIASHPMLEITAIGANRRAGEKVAAVFPHLAAATMPDFTVIDQIDFQALDGVFCAMPHGIGQKITAQIPEKVKIVDLSADFRLDDEKLYEKFYGQKHQAPHEQKNAVYGLPELYRREIANARLVANPGCYVTASLLPLLPLLGGDMIADGHIVIDAKSGISGAGRTEKQALLFSERADSIHAYAPDCHRHMAELDQEFTKIAGRVISYHFVPHIVPQIRGILATIYLPASDHSAQLVHAYLDRYYQKEPFIQILPFGQLPATNQIRGSNFCQIGVSGGRKQGEAILFSALDNLVKGASGQALQNMNLLLALDETSGLLQQPLFP